MIFGEKPVGVVPTIFIIDLITLGSPRRLEDPSSSSCMKKEEDHAIGISIEQAALFMLATFSPTNQEGE